MAQSRGRPVSPALPGKSCGLCAPVRVCRGIEWLGPVAAFACPKKLAWSNGFGLRPKACASRMDVW